MKRLIAVIALMLFLTPFALEAVAGDTPSGGSRSVTTAPPGDVLD